MAGWPNAIHQAKRLAMGCALFWCLTHQGIHAQDSPPNPGLELLEFLGHGELDEDEIITPLDFLEPFGDTLDDEGMDKTGIQEYRDLSNSQVEDMLLPERTPQRERNIRE